MIPWWIIPLEKITLPITFDKICKKILLVVFVQHFFKWNHLNTLIVRFYIGKIELCALCSSNSKFGGIKSFFKMHKYDDSISIWIFTKISQSYSNFSFYLDVFISYVCLCILVTQSFPTLCDSCQAPLSMEFSR